MRAAHRYDCNIPARERSGRVLSCNIPNREVFGNKCFLHLQSFTRPAQPLTDA